MSLLVPSGSHYPVPLPSLPPSPTEEDIGSANWTKTHEQDARPHSSTSTDRRSRSSSKGKSRASVTIRETSRDTSGGDSDTIATRMYDEYPPMNEEEEESRRVAENLKRWEELERQRRKAARASVSSLTPSMITEFASKLWSNRKAQHRGREQHQALQTDEHLTLDNIAGAPPSYSRPSSPALLPAAENPFKSENPSSTSLNIADQDAIMRPTPVSVMFLTPDHSSEFKSRPSLSETSLPTLQPEMTTTRHHSDQSDLENQPPGEVRWWTDWLCGCSEGPERGGDFQAGRTNPLE